MLVAIYNRNIFSKYNIAAPAVKMHNDICNDSVCLKLICNVSYNKSYTKGTVGSYSL